MGDSFQNIANDHSTVYSQVGKNEGQVSFGASASDQLYMLRTALMAARNDGALDEPTFAAAETELDEAIAGAPPQGEPPTGRFLLAMRRFSELVSGSAELAKAAGAIMALTEGTQ